MNLPKSDIGSFRQHQVLHRKVSLQLEKSTRKQEVSELSITWDFEFDMGLKNTGTNNIQNANNDENHGDAFVSYMKDFVGLENILDPKRPILKLKTFLKYTRNLKDTYRDATCSYRDQSFGLIKKGDEVLGFIGTSN